MSVCVIVNAVDSVSTNVTNTIPTNMINTVSKNVTSIVIVNSDHKKVRYKMDCYILHTFLSMIILLSIIAIISKSLSKTWVKTKKHIVVLM